MSATSNSATSQSPANRWLVENGPNELELLFRAIVYHPTAPVLITDQDGTSRDASVGAGKLLGLPREKIIGRPVDDFADAGSRPQISELWRALHQGEQEGTLRLAGPDPLVVETSHLPAARFPGLETVDFNRVRLYDTLLTRYRCRPTRARESFEPILLSADEASLLDQHPGQPALRVERIAFDQDDIPIEFCRSTVRGDRYRYSVELRDR